MSFTVVLCEPQSLMNIAHVVRAMTNFGARELRLVRPAEFDVHRITGIAHQSQELVSRAERVPSLDEALADATFVVGFTARQRSAKRNASYVREGVREAVGFEDEGRVVFLFGREDRGLDNEALDRCHRTVTIPTADDHPSLNLGHAAAIALYERSLVVGEPAPLRAPKRSAPLATADALEALFGEIEESLQAVDFFKSRNQASIMRSVREIGHRTPLDAREANLIKAIAIEVRRFMARMQP